MLAVAVTVAAVAIAFQPGPGYVVGRTGVMVHSRQLTKTPLLLSSRKPVSN